MTEQIIQITSNQITDAEIAKEQEQKILFIKKIIEDLYSTNNNSNIILNTQYTSTTELNRSFLKMFQPTERPKYINRREIMRFNLNDQQYALFITGKLGTNHKNLLDLIIYSAYQKKFDSATNTCIVVKTRLYDVNKAFSNQNRDYYAKLLEDIKTAHFFIAKLSEDGKRYTGVTNLSSIINDFRITISDKKPKTANIKKIPNVNATYDIWLSLSKFMSYFYYTQMLCNYDPFAISEFKYGVNKAIMSFLKSHNQNTPIEYHIDTILKKIGIDDESLSYRIFKFHRVQEIKSESDIYLKNGFFVDKKRNVITNKNIETQFSPLASTPQIQPIQPMDMDSFI